MKGTIQMRLKTALLLFVLPMIILFAHTCVAAQTAQPSPRPSAQATPAPESSNQVPAARPADVASVDSIIAAVYDVISGPAGQARDWNRFRSLFAPGARLIPIRRRVARTNDPNFRSIFVTSLTPEEFIQTASRFMQTNGFFEREINRRTERFGRLAHVFSTYESRRALSDATPFARGINSIQLFNDGERWWVVTIYWETETEGNPIPGEYLPARR
jgi:hypothetical protein